MMAATVAACTAGARPRVMAMQTVGQGETSMYGLIGKMTATPGQRDALIAILLEGTSAMPGCLSYIVAADPADPDAVWITEVWDGEASHKASLALPAVQHAITRARPLIAGFSNRTVTVPVGGVGLHRSPASSTPGD
jgi:quinol monooxygenase YgiN